MIKNVIFDLDGTLLYTLEDIANACNSILAQHFLPTHPVAEYRMMVGNGFDVLVRRALGPGNFLDEKKIADITAEAKNYYFSHLMDKTIPYPGIRECLTELAGNGRSLAVLSNKPDSMTKLIIKHFFPDIPFSMVQGAIPDMPLKPAPDSLLDILENFSWKPDESLYVGDSNIDVITGKNANLKVAAVCWGFRDRQELESANPDFLCSCPDELIKVIL